LRPASYATDLHKLSIVESERGLSLVGCNINSHPWTDVTAMAHYPKSIFVVPQSALTHVRKVSG